jgi:hypothetical protein
MQPSFLAGTSGRLVSATIPQSTTSDMPPGFGDNELPNPLPVGVLGADIKSWNFEDSTQSEPVYTQESPVNANGVVYPTHLRGGISPGAKVSIEGVYSRGALSSHRFSNGSFVVANFIMSKLINFGYREVVCKVESYRHGTQASGSPQTFSCTLLVQGVPPVPTAV